jgi:hypothetical protein
VLLKYSALDGVQGRRRRHPAEPEGVVHELHNRDHVLLKLAKSGEVR